MKIKGYLVLQSGEIFAGRWHGGEARAGEVVFNTSHAGYEEIATDPSYFSQIVVMTAPMQGNYGVDRAAWESRKMWIEGFISQEMQISSRDSAWCKQLLESKIPVLSDLDTREIVLKLRDQGTTWGALVPAGSENEAKEIALSLIKKKSSEDLDWVYAVSRREKEIRKGLVVGGPRVAVLDYGCKENTLKELQARCSEVAIFPSRTPLKAIQEWAPQGVMLSNGPGDPQDVRSAVETVKGLLGVTPVFGICMGNQILALALGAKTFKLKFGHRGGNHPVQDFLTEKIYVTSQNHGYAIDPHSLPADVRVSHVNLNDKTIEGIQCARLKCMSVQYHPESHPGPHEARILFDYFLEQLK